MRSVHVLGVIVVALVVPIPANAGPTVTIDGGIANGWIFERIDEATRYTEANGVRGVVAVMPLHATLAGEPADRQVRLSLGVIADSLAYLDGAASGIELAVGARVELARVARDAATWGGYLEVRGVEAWHSLDDGMFLDHGPGVGFGGGLFLRPAGRALRGGIAFTRDTRPSTTRFAPDQTFMLVTVFVGWAP